MTSDRLIRNLTLATVVICLTCTLSSGQTFYVTSAWNLLKVQLNADVCSCDVTTVGPHPNGFGGMTFSPEGELYYLQDTLLDAESIQHVDTLTSFTINTLMTGPSVERPMGGIVGVGNGIFYSSPPCMETGLPPTDTLFRWNTNDQTVTALGATGYGDALEMCIANGVIYYIAPDLPNNVWHIIQVDTLIPSNSQIAVSYNYSQYYVIQGLTASPYCNSLVGSFSATGQLVLISLVDGAITVLCEVPQTIGYSRVTSMLEFALEPPCGGILDLDCNNSSGATGADYNGPDFDCLSPGSGIADEDIKMLYDDIISQMTIEVKGFMPNNPYELVFMNGSVPGINVTGSGTKKIILSNGGGARSTEFKEALRNIVYKNTAFFPLAGMRTIDVQFTTESGVMSNVATAFILVNEIPTIFVDLGPDQEACEGESATFDAGNPGAIYQWNTGQHSQTISAWTSGQYIVHVANGINCPNEDTVALDILPVIHVSLTGDSVICDNEHADMTIITDTPFSLEIEITPDPGSPFSLTDITDDFSFFDLPGFTTEYTITNVTLSEHACIELVDPTQLIEVNPTYMSSVDTSICSGDSIFFGYYWENQAGQYNILFNSVKGCDSTVHFNLSLLPAVYISVQTNTCDSSAAGVFITHLNNPNGCDTVVQTTIAFLASDTTMVSQSSCSSSATGVFQQMVTNQHGCDSLIITTISLIPPDDTTMLAYTTCDSSLMGVFQQLLVDQSGCDSLVITTVSPGKPDSTYLYTTSCDSSSLGVFQLHFNSQTGCDSTVFTTISYSASDSTFSIGSSCDPGDVGVFTQLFVNRFGCDSIVTMNVTLNPSHQTMINSTTCDPAAAGVFIQNLTNQFGCDSMVTETVTLLQSDQTFLFSTTCVSAQTGIFIANHLNQNGCDSIVTLTVSLVPADTTILSFSTCDPAQVGSIQNSFTNQDGCDSLVIEQTGLYPLPHLQIQISSDYNGFDISCSGEADGSVIANVSGVPPYLFIWSTGSTDDNISGLVAGSYAVTITDGNGCETYGEVILTDPGPLAISFMVSQPDCFDQKNGSISVEQTGGIAPFRYSIDGINYQSSPAFTGLTGGAYQFTVYDANDCEVKEIILINVPLFVDVALGDDQYIETGDTAIINAIVNVPFDSLFSIVWSGLLNPDCPTCLTQPVVPIVTSTYSVTITSEDGCSDEDTMTLFLEKNADVYVPNIFSPNGDNINDKLIISAGSEVEEISSFFIFDRWGNMVFSANHFQANDSTYAWDGRFNGRVLNSAVFAYKLIAVIRDGTQVIIVGDVTLLR